MEKSQFFEDLKNKSSKLNIAIDDKQSQKFYDYMKLLLEWNEKMNLTAITHSEEIITKHFIDSITILNYTKNENKIIDVGTGAGFPGIPLNIVNDKLEYTLLDSLNKRVVFLNEVINKLDLNNIKAIHSRAEDYAKGNREKYDIAVSRAVAPLNVLVEYLLPLVKVGGACICMKGANVSQETLEAKNAIEILGGKIEKVEEMLLPDSNMSRNIIIVRKIKETPKKFPRKSGMASKEPII